MRQGKHEGRVFQTEEATCARLKWVRVRCITGTGRRSPGGTEVSQGDISATRSPPMQKIIGLVKFGV